MASPLVFLQEGREDERKIGLRGEIGAKRFVNDEGEKQKCIFTSISIANVEKALLLLLLQEQNLFSIIGGKLLNILRVDVGIVAISQNKLMTDYPVGPCRSLNLLDL